jgi:hypothetical protein
MTVLAGAFENRRDVFGERGVGHWLAGIGGECDCGHQK